MLSRLHTLIPVDPWLVNQRDSQVGVVQVGENGRQKAPGKIIWHSPKVQENIIGMTEDWPTTPFQECI